MANDDFGNFVGGLLIVIIALGILYVIVVFILPTTAALGAAFGGCVALRNYGRSFITNVRPDGDPNGTIAKGIIISCLAAVLVSIAATAIHFWPFFR